MKKTLCMLLAVLMVLSLAACGAEKQEKAAEEGFKPALDTSTSCKITVAGGYDNFEALEAEFDRFNEYYPDVELVFWTETMRLISMSITHGCMAGISINLLSIMPKTCPILRLGLIWTVSAAISC